MVACWLPGARLSRKKESCFSTQRLESAPNFGEYAAQEKIDSVSVDSDEEAGFFAQLLECDESLEREGRASLDAWVTKRLQFDYQRLNLKRSVGISTAGIAPWFR